ncbi:hypothetical protein HK100_012475 [Physocladia obscura]|uniref:Aldose 1-epimerase n=1 Tax=Physocladia obscura TaxID=109957 RepID=A0AAD5XLF2_9FUNG|nr:hypothetical protein HK100_012475 [Physocladia obscura]
MTSDLTLASSDGSLRVILRPLGATIANLFVADRAGITRDVVHGYDSSVQQRDCKTHPFYGTIGRVANRIAGGKFKLNGKTYTLVTNNGPNTLHGGIDGFDRREWVVVSQSTTTVVFSLTSGAGDEGFPLPVTVTVAYSIVGNSLEVDYQAFVPHTENTDESQTIVNLTSHTYFNLSGLANNSVLTHTAHFPNSRGYMLLNNVQIPTGEIIAATTNSAMDFSSSPKQFGKNIDQVQEFKGYDHFYVTKDFTQAAIDKNVKNAVQLVAKVSSPDSGITMEMLTDAVGFQLYTANFNDGSVSTKSATQPEGVYGQYSGFCLETSAPPDAINSPDENIRSLVVINNGGEKWSQKTIFRFSIEK